MKNVEESVWDYPRPPRVERSGKLIEVILDAPLAATSGALRVLETSHPPVYYIPLADVREGALQASRTRATFCEWKGVASYYDVIGSEGTRVKDGAWGYAQPSAGFEALTDTVSFYAGALECFLDGERVQAQEGNFYGGWITSEIRGPFKGGPGTQTW